jgi:hypothetical protein
MFRFVLIASLLFSSMALSAQTSLETPKWGAEFNVIWPFVPGVEIYTGKMTRTLWDNDRQRGDLTFGFLWRPGTDQDENADIFREVGLNLGYRQYIWKGWHVELAFYPSFATTEGNKVDGMDYQGLALTTEGYTGYQFRLGGKDRNRFWYLMPQAGIGWNPYADLGPELESGGIFPTLNLQVGFAF